MLTDNQPEISLGKWIRRKTAGVFIVHGIGVGLLFIMHTIVTRRIGPINYGIFSHALALATMISSLGVLGWPTALMRFSAEYDAKEKWKLLRGVFIRGYQISTSATLFIGVCLWTVTLFSGFPPDLKNSFRFAGLIIPFTGLVLLSQQALRGLHVILFSIIPSEVVLPIAVCLGIYLFSVITAVAALWIYFASTAICLFILLGIIYHRLNKKTSGYTSEYRTRQWVTTATPMMFSNLSQMVMRRIDIIMLGFLAPMSEVGFYSAAFRISALNMFVLIAVSTVVAPVMASSFQKGHYVRYYRVLFNSVALSIISTVPIAGVMIIWPGLPLSFFGEEFIHGSSSILILLTVAQFIDSATGPVGMALLMSGRERLVLFSNLPVAIAKIILNYVAIKQYGAIGAAWIAILCVCLTNGLNWYFVLRERTTHLKFVADSASNIAT